jgi:menaquinone-dependent protoporphyrinogen oxidase
MHRRPDPSIERTTLIAYSTVDGHTLKICGRLKRVLEGLGHRVALLDISNVSSLDVASFDQVVVGASIRYGMHRPDLYRFIKTNREALDRRPSAFFSVNIVARKAGKDTIESNPYVRAFRRKTTWAPRELGVFAGRLDYPRYGFIDRQIIRLIMWLTHGPTDPTACIEFTDWQSVERFAHRVSSMARAGSGSGQASGPP